jgi:hypothetical protein
VAPGPVHTTVSFESTIKFKSGLSEQTNRSEKDYFSLYMCKNHSKIPFDVDNYHSFRGTMLVRITVSTYYTKKCDERWF